MAFFINIICIFAKKYLYGKKDCDKEYFRTY